MQLVRALVVDDSAIFRMLVNNALAAVPNVTVVGRSRDGKEAINMIRVEKPDLVTLDVEMPVMDGLTTLREIRKLAATEEAFRKVKVVLVSALTKSGTDTTIQGLNEGAMECIPKPADADVEKNQETLRSHLQRVVEIVRAQIVHSESSTSSHEPHETKWHETNAGAQNKPYKASPSLSGSKQKPQAIAIGVSTGGPAALSAMLPELSKCVSLPIFIVQHMPPGFTRSLADSLAKKCKHRVVEATHDELVVNNCIYVAPGGKHMTVVQHGNDKRIALNDNPAENGCRPAVDVLFRSVANTYGGKITAVILTGMGSDGTLGARPLRDAGASLIVQDKESSVVWGMPGSAVDAGVAEQVLPLMQIPEAVLKTTV